MSIVLCGMGGSGKDTVRELLLNKGYNRVISYTSRPMRPNEVDGREYHFVNEDYFCKYSEKFLEMRSYDTVNGIWMYGSTINGYQSANGIGILTPSGARIVKKKLGNEAFVVYLNTPRHIAFQRMLKRGDDIDESYRRNLSDVGMFEGFERDVDYVIWTDNLTPEQIAQKIDINYSKWERGEF